MRPNTILLKQVKSVPQTRSDRVVLMKTILNIIHNLNVAVKINKNNNFRMLLQKINFKLLNFLMAFMF